MLLLASNFKFLIIRLSSIGDVILTTPLVRCLRAQYPGSEIDFLIKKEFSVVLSNNPHLSKIITFDKKDGKKELRRVKQLVKQNKYTHILDIQQNIRSIYISLGLGARVTGYSKKLLSRDLLIRFGINTYHEIKPVYLRYFEAASKLGVAYDGQGTEVFPPDSEIRNIAELMLNNNLHLKPLLVIAPGAQWENKRWPESGFASAADEFCARTGAQAVLIGGPGDAEICAGVEQLMKNKPLNLCAKLSLMGSAAVLGRAAMVFTNDTGMLHMAQAMKAPVVAVYGPTTQELGFFPMPQNSRVAETSIACRPCTQKGLHSCPKTHFRCMNDIKPEVVSSLALELFTLKNH